MNYASAAFWVLCEEGMDYSTHEVVQGNRSTVRFVDRLVPIFILRLSKFVQMDCASQYKNGHDYCPMCIFRVFNLARRHDFSILL